ncbi:MAG: hypothetical protein ACI9HK_003312 [Pirellulaceae bacterium]|jgi:hypothetical protein
MKLLTKFDRDDLPSNAYGLFSPRHGESKTVVLLVLHHNRALKLAAAGRHRFASDKHRRHHHLVS